MVDPRPAARRFVADVIDAIRVLRAADALRQRGTTQRTSAGYEICVDRRSGRAVMAMRSADCRFGALMWVDNHHSIAEGNLRVVDLTDEGSLRIAFHRGEFSDDGATERVVTATAATIADIEADVLGSFRPEPGAPRSACLVEVAGPPDNPDFARLVVEALERDHPRMAGRTVLVDEPHPTPRTEVADWYRRGRALAVDEPGIDECFEQLARHGLNVAGIDRPAALRDVRRSRLRRGEVVLAAGTAASVVVIPLEPGTRVEPIGGYPPEAAPPLAAHRRHGRRAGCRAQRRGHRRCRRRGAGDPRRAVPGRLVPPLHVRRAPTGLASLARRRRCVTVPALQSHW